MTTTDPRYTHETGAWAATPYGPCPRFATLDHHEGHDWRDDADWSFHCLGVHNPKEADRG